MIPPDWSAPDAAGIRTLSLDVGAVSTLRGRRRRRAFPDQPSGPDAWPADWRQLAADWLRRGEGQRRWDSLLKVAGHARYAQAEALRDALLAGGWIEVEERFAAGRWQTTALAFPDPAALRAALGLPDPGARRAEWAAARDGARLPAELDDLAAGLDGQPAPRALARLALLSALAGWRADGRSGTWRDFGQYARGDTKAITESERAWLANALDLEVWGLAGHAPLLLLAGPLVLVGPAFRLDLAGLPGFVGLPPQGIAALEEVTGTIGAWRLVENRTSFERAAAAHGRVDAVLWLPGFAPSWWREALATLLARCPAPGLVACDPDPAGVAIALNVGRVFQAAGLTWQAWRMAAADLAALPRRRPLTDDDRSRLAALDTTALPPGLSELVDWMDRHGEKGEQEGLI